jgi:hypothetical protein
MGREKGEWMRGENDRKLVQDDVRVCMARKA